MSIFGTFILLIASAFSWMNSTSSQQDDEVHPIDFKDEAANAWADNILSQLSLEEKIAQLITIEAATNKDEAYRKEIVRQIAKYGIGGLMFKKGYPSELIRINNEVQAISKVPVLFSIDGEWGVNMRIDSFPAFPWMMTQGAVQDDSLIYWMGAEVARQCKTLGIQINFAPVVDVNSNPKNPIINSRSFGEDPDLVAKKGSMYMKGMQDHGVMACAKHFPGHGDTDQDSHKTLPSVLSDREQLDSIELLPFRALIEEGIGSIMCAHLRVPALEKKKDQPTSLSRKVVTELLQEEYGFEGLIITDGLNMAGAKEQYPDGELEVQAILAGNDMLLLPANVPVAIEAIMKAIDKGRIEVAQIDRSCKKILITKYLTGLADYRPLDVNDLELELDPVSSKIVRKQLFEEAITVVRNENQILPITDLEDKRIAIVSFEEDVPFEFKKSMGRYTECASYSFDPKWSSERKEEVLLELKDFDLVVTSIHKLNSSPWKSYEISEPSKTFISQIDAQNEVVLCVFANPYSLLKFPETLDSEALVMCYQNSTEAQSAAAQVLFGALDAKGKLPVGIGEGYPCGFGLSYSNMGRLQYGIPEEVGLRSSSLNAIDEIVESAMDANATPGCQVLVARKGKVVFNKSYGYHTYEQKRMVQDDDLYDLASITKIAATLPGVMEMWETEALNLDDPLVKYLPEVKGSNKERLVIREILAHQSRLTPWIPFYKETLADEGGPSPDYYNSNFSEAFGYEVCNELYMRSDWPDSIFNQILESGLLSREGYKYSDLGYYFLQRIVENHFGASLSRYVQDRYYGPLGASTSGYHPRSRFEEHRIVPTEHDPIFRRKLVHGHVHDPGAAMMGGVGGHAGLFSSANDLAKYMQMLLQGGSYGGVQYFEKETIDEFTKCQFCKEDNRRGAGFDKPTIDGRGGPTCDCVSLLSFGHSGFTGTLAWVDPEEEIVYIFLSNCVHPSADNKKLISMNVRTDIQEVIHNSIIQ